MPMRKMGQLVAEHRGELSLIFHAGQDPRMQVDRPVGQRKGVEERVLNDLDSRSEPLSLNLRREQPLRNRGQIRVELRTLVTYAALVDAPLELFGVLPDLFLILFSLKWLSSCADRREIRGRARRKRE